MNNFADRFIGSPAEKALITYEHPLPRLQSLGVEYTTVLAVKR
jgi:hypothetical protein